MTILRVNLAKRLITKESMPERVAHLGGRGVTSTLINDQRGTCDKDI